MVISGLPPIYDKLYPQSNVSNNPVSVSYAILGARTYTVPANISEVNVDTTGGNFRVNLPNTDRTMVVNKTSSDSYLVTLWVGASQIGEIAGELSSVHVAKAQITKDEPYFPYDFIMKVCNDEVIAKNMFGKCLSSSWRGEAGGVAESAVLTAVEAALPAGTVYGHAGGHIHLASSIFYLTTPFVTTKTIRLTGNGAGSSILYYLGSNGTVITLDASTVGMIGGEISNIQIHCGNRTNNALSLISAVPSTICNMKIGPVHIEHCYDGIVISASTQVCYNTFDSIYVHDFSRYAINQIEGSYNVFSNLSLGYPQTAGAYAIYNLGGEKSSYYHVGHSGPILISAQNCGIDHLHSEGLGGQTPTTQILLRVAGIGFRLSQWTIADIAITNGLQLYSTGHVIDQVRDYSNNDIGYPLFCQTGSSGSISNWRYPIDAPHTAIGGIWKLSGPYFENSGTSTGTGSEQTITHALTAIPTGCKAWITYQEGEAGDYVSKDVTYNATHIKVTMPLGVAYTWRIE